jgi:hypothetical protein
MEVKEYLAKKLQRRNGAAHSVFNKFFRTFYGFSDKDKGRRAYISGLPLMPKTKSRLGLLLLLKKFLILLM